MSNLSQEEIEILKRATKETWNEVCDNIKDSHQGNWPYDWFQVVVLGGMIPGGSDIEIITTSK